MEPNEVIITGTQKMDGKYEVKPEIAKAIAAIREKEKEKSFSGRHPELGKMVSCTICSRRHRTAEICLQVFAKNKKDVELVAKGPGTRKARRTPHWNQRSLQLVQLTRELLLWYPNGTDEKSEAARLKKARSRALNLLRAEWHAKSQRMQAQQKLSRRINRG